MSLLKEEYEWGAGIELGGNFLGDISGMYKVGRVVLSGVSNISGLLVGLSLILIFIRDCGNFFF